MGVMRFLVSSPMPSDWPGAAKAYISGADGRVFPTQVEFRDNLLICRRPVSDSGRLYVPWPIEGFGQPVVCTASLPERDDPYLLVVELARGKIAQIRDQISAWEIAGMTIPAALHDDLKTAYGHFGRATAIQDQSAEAAGLGTVALQHAFKAAETAMAAYTAQRLATRRRRPPHLPVALGCGLGQWRPDVDSAKPFVESFTIASIPVEWKTIERQEGEQNWDLADAQVDWCLANRLLVYGGPLLDFSPAGLPEWVEPWKGHLTNLQSFVCNYVETAVARFAGRIRNWDVCARANTGGALGISEENRLSLTARALDVVRQVDEEVQIMIHIDQPWGEYQSRGQHRLAPLQFVDALLRSGIGLSTVNLELAVGFRPVGSAHRDLLELSRMLDQWSSLGVPLYVSLACPSDSRSADPNCASNRLVDSDGWVAPWDEASQAAWIDSVLPVLMSKQAVVGTIWEHYSDQAPHEFPHAGLLRADGTPKPALQHFSAQRHAFSQFDI
jgi:hypothetical protein